VLTALHDPTGKLRGFGKVTRDITTRKQAEEETNALLRTIHLHSIVSVADRAGRIIEVNDSFCAISGYTREELLNHTHQILNSGTHSRQFWTQMWHQISSGKSWRGEICNRARNGSLYWVDSIIAPFFGEGGQATRYISIRTDITAAKLSEGRLRLETQKAEVANNAKSDFLANMSHEIRTPMNAILGMTHLALRAQPTEQQRRYLRKIENASQSLLVIMNDILDFSKIEAGKLELENINVSLDEIWSSLLDIVSEKAEQKSLPIRFNVQHGTPRYFKSDPLRLGQILINLVNNAIKFTDRGEIVVNVTAEPVSPGHTKLKFSVRDTGIGMSPHQMSSLFQSFHQADTSFTRTYGGTGLGLAISKQLCELMGGTISAQSEPGKGSTFVFTSIFEINTLAPLSTPRATLANPAILLDDQPRDITSDSTDSIAESMPPVAAHQLAGRRVLLVEDNELNRDLATELLGDLGITVAIAVNGRDGADRIASELFDLVLMDIQMPVLDGLAATRLIREDHRFRNLPIIATTAHAMGGDRERSLRAGLNDHLTKPIDPKQLTKALVRWLPRKPPQRQTAMDLPAEPAESDVALPEHLPPFDIRRALVRANSNPKLLRKLMRGFAQHYTDVGEHLRDHLAEERFTDAERMAHSLKSVAAMLEAQALAAAASALEQALRVGQLEHAQALIHALEGELKPAMDAARSLDASFPAVPVSTTAPLEPVA
jgi:PAS domain S-box-containing protein